MKKILLISSLFILLSGCALIKNNLATPENKNTNPVNNNTIPVNNNTNSDDKIRVITTKDLAAALASLKQVDAKTVNENNYPKVLGVYSENGLILVERYYCSDVCPAYARLDILYNNIKSKEDCDKIGGQALIDPAWKTYIGCAPVIEEGYTCPEKSSYNCQPIVAPENIKYCSGAYRQWAQKNCGTKYVD